MLNLDSLPVKQVQIGGKTYEVHGMKVRDQKQMAMDLKGLDPESVEHFDIVLKHIGKCGVPVEVIEDMEASQLKQFIEFLSEKKS